VVMSLVSFQCILLLCSEDIARAFTRWANCPLLHPSAQQWSVRTLRQSLSFIRWQNNLLWQSFWCSWGVIIDSRISEAYMPINWEFFFSDTLHCQSVPTLQFFADSGFPCPPKRNPSDHFLRCVNSDFDKVKSTTKSSLRHRVIVLQPFLSVYRRSSIDS
jgi:hypothetical protein